MGGTSHSWLSKCLSSHTSKKKKPLQAEKDAFRLVSTSSESTLYNSFIVVVVSAICLWKPRQNQGNKDVERTGQKKNRGIVREVVENDREKKGRSGKGKPRFPFLRTGHVTFAIHFCAYSGAIDRRVRFWTIMLGGTTNVVVRPVSLGAIAAEAGAGASVIASEGIGGGGADLGTATSCGGIAAFDGSCSTRSCWGCVGDAAKSW